MRSVVLNLNYTNNKLYIKYAASHSSYDSVLQANFIPAGGHFNLTKDQYISHPIRLPFFGKGNFYDRVYKTPMITVKNNGNPVYSFGHRAEIREYDLNSGDVHSHKMASLLIDTITPEKTENPNFEIENGRYVFLQYNPFDERFYRFYILPVPQNAPPKISNSTRFGVIVADKNFNIIAEDLLPETADAAMVLFSEEGLWFRTKSAYLDKKNSNCYTLYELDFIDSNPEKIKNKLAADSKENVPTHKENAYLFAKEILADKLQKHTGIILIPMNSCPSCIAWTCNYFFDNIDLMQEKNIHLILSGNQNVFKAYLQGSDLPETHANLHRDTVSLYQDYIYNFVNPRMFYFSSDSLSFDKIYNPADLYYMAKDIDALSQ